MFHIQIVGSMGVQMAASDANLVAPDLRTTLGIYSFHNSIMSSWLALLLIEQQCAQPIGEPAGKKSINVRNSDVTHAVCCLWSRYINGAS